MNEDEKVVTNNPEKTLEEYQANMKKPHDNKMALLLVLTILFGTVAAFSLFFAFKNNFQALVPKKEMLRDRDTTEEPALVKTEETQEEKDDELGTQALTKKIDAVNFDDILENLSDQKLTEDLE